MYDGIMLYAYALNESIAAGEDPFDGKVITSRMWNRTIPSYEGGYVKVLDNGVKDQSYDLLQVSNSTGDWDVCI